MPGPVAFARGLGVLADVTRAGRLRSSGLRVGAFWGEAGLAGPGLRSGSPACRLGLAGGGGGP
jgi:hypothetical protein